MRFLLAFRDLNLGAVAPIRAGAARFVIGDVVLRLEIAL